MNIHYEKLIITIHLPTTTIENFQFPHSLRGNFFFLPRSIFFNRLKSPVMENIYVVRGWLPNKEIGRTLFFFLLNFSFCDCLVFFH